MIHVRAIVGNYLNCRKIHQERNPIENFHEGQSMKIISHFSKITIISYSYQIDILILTTKR